ncbi:transposase [Plakobranchus ocellatus]|uniref:Transposase n=1 Tax=Plakobranchus ocellatus TaxID=259542 RepID=A0AAV3YBH2_9GAST|nr:transposase [Plakobranchus ocellatus]
MNIHALPHINNNGFVHVFNQKKNILSGFKSTGIYPFDRNIIPDERYLPSYTSDRPIKENSAECSSADTSSSSVNPFSHATASPANTRVPVSTFVLRSFGKVTPCKETKRK